MAARDTTLKRHQIMAPSYRFGFPRCAGCLTVLTAKTVDLPCPKPLPTLREIALTLLKATD